MPSKLIEKREELAAKQDQLHQIFQRYPDYDMPADVAADIKRRNDELTDIGKAYDELRDMAAIAEQTAKAHGESHAPGAGPVFPGGDAGGNRPAVKSVGQVLQESRQYQAFRAGEVKSVYLPALKIGLDASAGTVYKTLFALTSGGNNLATRLPDPVLMALEQRTVADLMMQGDTDNNTISYLEETTLTNAATTVAEGAAKPESALAFTERTETIRKIATWIPATKEALADITWIQSYIEGRLRYMVKRMEETQLLTGNGTPPNLTGITARAGIQTQARGTDSNIDAIFKALQLIRVVAFAEPSAVVLHPTNWQTIRLTKTADGIYIYGSPTEAGPERIWGLPVRQTTAMTLNTGLVGAFDVHAQVIRREDVDITISTEHASYFIENKVAILAEERLGLAVFRPAAFATVTGLN